MNDDHFNKFVDKLEDEIIKKEIEDHNEYIVKLFRNPQNWGKPPEEKYNLFQECQGEQGEILQLYFNINKRGIIKDVHFVTNGCGCMIATASQMTILLKDRSIQYAKSLKPEDIDKALKGLPEHEKHCTELAIFTLKKLIFEYER